MATLDDPVRDTPAAPASRFAGSRRRLGRAETGAAPAAVAVGARRSPHVAVSIWDVVGDPRFQLVCMMAGGQRLQARTPLSAVQTATGNSQNNSPLHALEDFGAD